MLIIRPEQIVMLSERRVDAMHRRIAAYLREVASDIVEYQTDAELKKGVKDSFRRGASLGLESEQAHCRWAYMMLMSGGRIDAIPE